MLPSVLLAEDGPPFLGAVEVVAKQCVIPIGWGRQVDHPIEQDGRGTTFARQLGAPEILVCAELHGIIPLFDAAIPKRSTPRAPGCP